MAYKPILIVEDDVGIRSCLEVLFELRGYPVLLAEHGQAALDLIKTSATPKPGLIFLDLMMPVMDGPTFLSELQRNHPQVLADIPIFMMTASPDKHRLTIKTTGFLKKPFELSELSRIAAQYCAESDHDTAI